MWLWIVDGWSGPTALFGLVLFTRYIEAPQFQWTTSWKIGWQWLSTTKATGWSSRIDGLPSWAMFLLPRRFGEDGRFLNYEHLWGRVMELGMWNIPPWRGPVKRRRATLLRNFVATLEQWQVDRGMELPPETMQHCLPVESLEFNGDIAEVVQMSVEGW